MLLNIQTLKPLMLQSKGITTVSLCLFLGSLMLKKSVRFFKHKPFYLCKKSVKKLLHYIPSVV